MRSVSGNAPTPRNDSIPTTGSDKPVSIEQSVRKFRIFEALRSGDTASISRAIRDLQASNAGGTTSSGLEDTTILHLAIQCAEVPVVEYVLSDGAGTIDVNARDKDGNTPLHIAAMQGRGQIVRLLLEQPGINDSITNYQGRLPLDLARTPDIFQQLQLSRSIFVDQKVKEVQDLVAQGDYQRLGEVLEEPRVKTVLDINSGEFASDLVTVQSGGTLLHEAARKRNTKLIQVLLLHGADPFRRDRKGKLPQDVTKDEHTRAMLKRSPAAVAAQRTIQEKAVLGHAAQNSVSSPAGDPVVGKEGREMKGYLKKWTNYRKGYQLRWFVLEDGVLSYYKHQDDAGSACRGAINMRIAKLSMDPAEKTKFDILGKSSVKYHLKANHEVEAKRWFWALNNSIQWSKDQAKEEDKQRAKSAELLRQAKAELGTSGLGKELSPGDLSGDASSFNEGSRNGGLSRLTPQSAHARSLSSQKIAFSSGSVEDDEGTPLSPIVTSGDELSRMQTNNGNLPDGDYDEEDYGDASSERDAPASKDAFDITAQSAKMQLEVMAQVHAAIQAELEKNPNLTISDPVASEAISTFDTSIHNLKVLLGDMLKISKDRDAYWQYRLDREADMRRMWEESMAKVAREQELLEAKVGESELKRKLTKRALREVMDGNVIISQSGSIAEATSETEFADASESLQLEGSTTTLLKPKPTIVGSLRRKSILNEITNLSDSESEDEDEFFDAVDAGEVEVAPMPPPPSTTAKAEVEIKEETVEVDGLDLTSSFRGYENGIRKKLKMDADDRPKISLWVSSIL